MGILMPYFLQMREMSLVVKIPMKNRIETLWKIIFSWSCFVGWRIHLDQFLTAPSSDRVRRFFFVCHNFEAYCPTFIQMRLKRHVSNHAHIFLCCHSGEKSNSPFKLGNFVLQYPDFQNNLKIWWMNLIFGKPSYIILQRTQSLKFFIKNSQKSTFGNLQTQIDYLELIIDVLDIWKKLLVYLINDIVAW